MKLTNPWKVSTVFLTAVLGVGAVYASARPAHADPQPRMYTALQLLEGAHKHLEAATHDKGGHRVKALAAVDEAIEQTKKGIAVDDKH